MHEFDMEALRDALTGAERMIEYYGKTATEAAKVTARNDVLTAAGLDPLPNEFNEWRLKYDASEADRYRRQAAALTAVIDMLEPEDAKARAARKVA